MRSAYDVVVVGSGPNGLTAAALAARRGLSVVVIEANDTAGGGVRSAPLTLPGFVHDVCASVMPMGAASPVFNDLGLGQHGLEWITPRTAAAHPLDDGEVVLIHNDVELTANALGEDRTRYLGSIGAIARHWPDLEPDILAPIGLPSHPLSFARFGLPALLPASAFGRWFTGRRARALFAGCAAHSSLSFSSPGSSAFGLVLAAVAHARGWPIARSGSQAVTDALVDVIQGHGGEIVTGLRVEHRDQLPTAKTTFFDTAPRTTARIVADRFPRRYAESLDRFRYGPGAFKVDWALSEPIPWKSRECLEAATVHVGGSFDEIATAEAAPWRDACAERPFVIVTQPSLFDPTRAPANRHTAWGYCHVSTGSTVDMTARIEAQVERFAPGFREVILQRSAKSPATIEAENANLIGGDVGGGANDLTNLVFRPTWRRYATPLPDVFLCSAATPPGGGVHGMCGYHAVRTALGRAAVSHVR